MANKLKSLREGLNFTQGMMAKELGVGYQTYCYYERGTLNPSAAKLYQIQAYFMIPIAEIFPDINTEHIAKLED